MVPLTATARIRATRRAPSARRQALAWIAVISLAGPGPAQEKAGDAALTEETPAFEPRPVKSWVEAQIELHRRGFSGGSIDGVRGPQSATALAAFQRQAGVPETGDLDRETSEALLLTAPPFTTDRLTVEEMARLAPLPTTWLGKSVRPRLTHATALEMIAEHHRSSPRYIQQLNPGLDWEQLLPGADIIVPAVERVLLEQKAAEVHIHLSERFMQVLNEDGVVFAHFPVSIARHVEKRPVGKLTVTVVIPDPDYTFDPAVFPESAEAQELGRKLILPPGPNNPVGVAWIGLDRPGYGIHGTPDPEKVGRTESHGCFRLANWDARTLLALAWVGMPVYVDP